MSKELNEIRNMIDRIDDSIIDLLSTRKKLVEQIALLKKNLNIKVIDNKREKELLKRLKEKARQKGLDEKLIDTVYEIILKNSRKKQNEIKQQD